MKKITSYYLVVSLLLTTVINAQVAINNTAANPDASAILDLKTGNTGVNKGLLPQAVSLSATNVAAPVISPATGLIVFNTSTAGSPPYNVIPAYYYWNGLQWTIFVNSPDTLWRQNGNALYENWGGVGIGTKSPQNLLHLEDTNAVGGTAILIEGGVGGSATQLWTHDTLNRPKKVWVLGNATNSTGNSLSITYNNGYKWINNVFLIQSGSPGNSLYIAPTGVGIGTSSPVSQLHVSNGDAYIDNSANGVIMKSPNGNCWRIQVNNSGIVTATAIACP